MDENYKLSAEMIAKIEEAIKHEERIEIVPSKRGPVIFKIRRKEIKPNDLR